MLAVLLCGAAKTASLPAGSRFDAVSTAGAAAVTLLLAGGQDALIVQLEQAVVKLQDLANVFLPMLATSAFLSGQLTASAAKYAAASWFFNVLVNLCSSFVLPAVRLYVAAAAAEAAVGGGVLSGVLGFLKWCVSMALTCLLLAFTLYLSLCSLTGNAADAAAGEPTAEGEPAAEPAPAPAFERDQAEAAFRRDIMPQLKSQSKSSDMSLDQALKSTDLPYLFAVRDAIARERRFPASLFFALRGAFHHRKLSFFRANEPRGQEFVCAAKPTPLDTEHAIPELVAVVKYVEEHPLCSVGELPPEMKGHLGWLVEKGHIVQYFNGLLALPEEHPRFRNPSPKKGGAEQTPQASAPAEATGTTGVSSVADSEGAVATQNPESASAVAEPAPAEPASAEPVAAEAPAQEPASAEPVADEAPAAEVNVVEEVKKEEISNEAADQLAE
jgi:hypothetical protein